MSHAIWTGVISFGLLHVPVQLVPAERRHELDLRMLDERDNSPIRYERVNSETGKEVPWKNIVKAYEHRPGEFIVLTDEEIAGAGEGTKQTVEIEAFVKAESIDPIYFEKPYFLLPVSKGEKGYVLLRETLRDSGYAGIAKVVLRTKQHLAVLIPIGPALVLNLVRFQQDLVDPEDYSFPDMSIKKYRIAPREIQMARQLIDSMAVDWKPADYSDETVDRLRKVIDARSKKAGRRASSKKPVQDAGPTKVVDFMSVLKKSLESNRRTPAARTKAKPKQPKAKTTRRRAS